MTTESIIDRLFSFLNCFDPRDIEKVEKKSNNTQGKFKPIDPNILRNNNKNNDFVYLDDENNNINNKSSINLNCEYNLDKSFCGDIINKKEIEIEDLYNNQNNIDIKNPLEENIEEKMKYFYKYLKKLII